MKYFRRSLFNYFTTPSKNVNHKNQKPSLFSVTVDIVQNLSIQVYTISPSTHSQLLFVNGIPISLYCAVYDKGDNYNIAIPLKKN